VPERFTCIRRSLRQRSLPLFGSTGSKSMRGRSMTNVHCRLWWRSTFREYVQIRLSKPWLSVREWRIEAVRDGSRPVDAPTFRAPQPPVTARAPWNFTVEEGTDGRCRLATETRVQCAHAASRRRLRY